MKKMRVGVIGGGQLAWMMAQEAPALDIELIVQTPSPDDSAVSLVTDVVYAKIDDAVATAELATRCDVITFENEFVDLDALAVLEAQGVCFRPSLRVLKPLLDKYQQMCYLRDLGLPVPRFKVLTSLADCDADWTFPVVLKACRHGYDGQGTFVIADRASLEAIWERCGQKPMLLQEFVPYERELAIIAVRSVSGEVVVYPVVETQQEKEVCHRVIAPAMVTEGIKAEINAIAHTILTKLEVVGILGIELFVTPTGKILVNEIAPRTHNSGHYTLDACITSQFAMQLQAVTGLPLGSPELKSSGALMVNLLGYEDATSDYTEKRAKLAAIPQTHVHWYHKPTSRPGRKLGHVTVLLDQQQLQQVSSIAQKIEAIWYQ